MEEEECAAKSRNIRVTILQRQWNPAEIFLRNLWEDKIEVGTDLDQRNDENRPSLTTGAAAEERQEVSSKNMKDTFFDAITGDKGIGLWSSNIAKKCRNIGWTTESYF